MTLHQVRPNKEEKQSGTQLIKQKSKELRKKAKAKAKPTQEQLAKPAKQICSGIGKGMSRSARQQAGLEKTSTKPKQDSVQPHSSRPIFALAVGWHTGCFVHDWRTANPHAIGGADHKFQRCYAYGFAPM